MNVLYGYLCAFGYLFGLILLFGVLQRKKLLKGEFTRKLVHIFIAFTWVIMDYFWGCSYHQIIMCASFVVINLLSFKFKLFPGIERAQKGHAGTVYYALAMLALAVCSFFYPPMYLPFGCAVFCLSFGDGIAPIAAVLTPKNIAIGKKSLVGTLACFVFSFVAVYVFSVCYGMGLNVLQAVGIAGVCSLIELFCVAGLDNFGITFAAALLCLAARVAFFGTSFWIGAVLSIAVLLPAATFRALTPAACFAAMLMLLIAGLCGIAPVLMYAIPFVIIALVGLLRHAVRSKAVAGGAGAETITVPQKKSAHRNLVQVLINGAIAAVFFLVFAFTDNQAFFAAAGAALSVAFSDSMASDVGRFSHKTPYDFIRRQSVQAGVSGGVTLLGTLASIFGAFIVAGLSCVSRSFSPAVFWSIAVAGVLGTFLDTVLGSCIQGLYRCKLCNKLCESKTHCDVPAVLVKGYAWVTNNLVNFVCVLVGAVAVCLLVLFV